MKKLLSLTFFALMGALLIFSSCSDDEGTDPTPDAPSVSAPSSSTEVQAEETVSITFTVAVPGGYESAAVTASGGSATISSEPSAGATSGNVDVEFTAGAAGGAGSVTLTVTDENGKSDNATAVLSIIGEETVITVTSNISTEATWESGKVYILGGRITVLDGATLTIEPGTIIKGEGGAGANSTALLVARGGTLMAEGTADAPIIFTSVLDEITPEDVAAGEFGSPNLDPDINGLWGGVIVLGNAYISASSVPIQIDGIPPTDTNGLYGSNDTSNDSESSGVLTYISIRHGGTNIGAGNEINGLTLGGVGSGTIISNIEVVANQDDGIEWFGGSVNVTNAVVWNAGDDGLDTDQAWNGTMDDFIIVNPSGSAFELDGPEGDDAAYFAGSRSPLNHTFVNGTVYMGMSPAAIDFDSDTNVDMESIYFYGFNDEESAQAVQEYAAMVDFAGGSLTDIEVTLPADYTAADIFVDVPAENVTEVAVNDNSVGSSADYSWTWASQSGSLAEIGL